MMADMKRSLTWIPGSRFNQSYKSRPRQTGESRNSVSGSDIVAAGWQHLLMNWPTIPRIMFLKRL